jgi:hypothetical protein
MRFYMGTIWISGRADLTQVYVMIFRRLRSLDADGICTPAIQMIRARQSAGRYSRPAAGQSWSVIRSSAAARCASGSDSSSASARSIASCARETARQETHSNRAGLLQMDLRPHRRAQARMWDARPAPSRTSRARSARGRQSGRRARGVLGDRVRAPQADPWIAERGSCSQRVGGGYILSHGPGPPAATVAAHAIVNSSRTEGSSACATRVPASRDPIVPASPRPRTWSAETPVPRRADQAFPVHRHTAAGKGRTLRYRRPPRGGSEPP